MCTRVVMINYSIHTFAVKLFVNMNTWMIANSFVCDYFSRNVLIKLKIGPFKYKSNDCNRCK